MLRHRRGLFAQNRFLINGLGLAGLLVLGGCEVEEPASSDGGIGSESCEDGIDNDCDGLIDGDDSTCQIDGVEDGRCAPDAGAGGKGGMGAGGMGGEGGAGGMGGAGGEGGVGAAGGGGEGGAVEPTCSDALQNGDETGVDCGGACPACPPPPECVDDEDCENGTCEGGECACAEGFERDAMGRCVDVDECAAAPCTGLEVCVNLPGGHECACPPGAPASAIGCAFQPSCSQIKANDPGAGDGTYAIDPDGPRPAPALLVYCDMTTDDGAGYTMLRIDSELLGVGPATQAAYHAACAERGMELVVPRSPNHMTSLMNFNGGFLNIIGVYPDFEGAVGLNHYTGRCQGAPCDFWLSDNNNASCFEGAFEPNGNSDATSALVRQAFAECGVGVWDDQGDSVEIGGFVVCSTNDAGPVLPRTCLDAAQREIRVNAGGDRAEPQNGLGVYTLDSDGPAGPLAPYQTWCEGEWTLVLKTAADSALGFAHPVWTGPDDLNVQSADLSPADARLPGYAQVSVGHVMLWMGDHFVTADIAGGAPSMQAIMAGDFVPTQIERAQWLAMVSDRRGGLQAHCNLQGFNAGIPGSQVRFGILSNNEMDCNSNDSFIGIGHSGEGLCGDAPIISGNGAAPRCGGGEVSHALPGLLFVREPDPLY